MATLGGLLVWLLLLQPWLREAWADGDRAQGGPPLPSPPPVPSGSGRRGPGASLWKLPPEGVPGATEAPKSPKSRVISASPHLVGFTPGDSDSHEALQAPQKTSPAGVTPISFVPTECGQRTMRIVGGRPAAQKKWPWQVSLRIDDEHICGGSLIADRWVLTAAHCIFGYKEYTVKIGDIHLKHASTRAFEVPVRDIVIHQDYSTSGTVENDIALAMLEVPVNYSPYIQPVCIPESDFLVQTDPKEASPEVLQEAEQYIIRHEKCNQIYKKKMSVSVAIVKEGNVCGYSALGKDSCQGDSGGPLVCEFNDTWVQVGIVSWGIGCGRKEFPGVYTEVSFYRLWVIDQMSKASSGHAAGFPVVPLCLLLPLGLLATL